MLFRSFGSNTYVEKDSTIQIDGITEILQTAGAIVGCLNAYILANASTSGICSWFGRTCRG